MKHSKLTATTTIVNRAFCCTNQQNLTTSVKFDKRKQSSEKIEINVNIENTQLIQAGNIVYIGATNISQRE